MAGTRVSGGGSEACSDKGYVLKVEDSWFPQQIVTGEREREDTTEGGRGEEGERQD